MDASPHPHQLGPSADLAQILEAFAVEVGKSWIRRKIVIDTSDLTPEGLVDVFLRRSIPHLDAEDAGIRALVG